MQQNAPRMKKNRKFLRLPLRVYLSYLFILTLIFTAVSFAKFATSGGSNGNARVATFAVDAVPLDESSAYSFDDAATSFKDKKSDSHTITVMNYTGNTVCEVALRYEIIVTIPDSAPDGAFELTIDGRNAATVNGRTYTFTGFNAIPAGTKSSDTDHTHTLTITAVSENITSDISKLGIDVSVYFEQID